MASGCGLNVHLSSLGKQIGLRNFVNPNPCQKGDVTESLVADSVEAVIGAMYVDGGEHKMVGVMKRLGVLST
jgi:dsRNA-specific ribonuclease